MPVIPRRIVCSTTTEIYTSYKSYLSSNHWHNVKEAFRQSKHCKRVCYVCGASDRINHHHRSYTNIGKEQPQDIVELCNPCHSKVHALARQGGKFNDICFAVEHLKHEHKYNKPHKRRKYLYNARVLTFDDL